MSSKVLVVVVTFNAMKWAERCFSSLYSSSLLPDVFVVDNGSTDGTQNFLRRLYPNIILVQSDDNIGFGKANNLGFQYALENEYDYVYLLNQDAWILPNTLESLIDISQNNLEYGILSPFQMEENLINMDKGFRNDSFIRNESIIDDLYNNELKIVYDVPVVMAAHWLVKIDCLRKVGGFSPVFKHYGEDYNYVDRVHYYGYKVGITPSLRVVHDRGKRVDSKKKIMYLNYVNDIRGLSMPDSSSIKLLAYYCLNYIKKSISTMSPIWLLYFYRIFRNYSNIKKNRRISMYEVCPFLDINKEL